MESQILTYNLLQTRTLSLHKFLIISLPTTVTRCVPINTSLSKRGKFSFPFLAGLPVTRDAEKNMLLQS
jgi:hypothetical protein